VKQEAYVCLQQEDDRPNVLGQAVRPSLLGLKTVRFLSPEPIRPSYDNSQRRTISKVAAMPVRHVTIVRLPLDTVWLINSGRPQSYMRAFVRVRANRMQPARAALPLQATEKNATSRLLSA
jgi:hypothetical protein